MYQTVTPHWSEAPPSPALAPGQVDVWLIRPGPSHPRAAADGGPLATWHDAVQDAMRGILARYLGVTADELVIDRLDGGKPYLTHPGPPTGFNLSHATGVAALLAVTRSGDVGVDIEALRRIDDPLRLARRALPVADASEIAALPGARRTERLLDYWTRMEARQKALGRGIFAAPADPARLSNVSFQPGPGLFASLSLSPRHDMPLRLRFFRCDAR
jgi:4'-phosphopantetheinyl transferase